MRSFPTVQSSYYAQYPPSENIRTNPRASTSTNPEDFSRIKSDIPEGVDLSSSSIESELKRIESFFSAGTKAFLQDLGPSFGRPEKQRDTAEFNTASFNSREYLRVPNLTKVNAKMPALFEVAPDNCQEENNSNNSSLYGLGEQSSEDMHGVPIGVENSISTSIRKYQEKLRNQEKINMSLQSDVEEQLDTFGMKMYPRDEVKDIQQDRNKAMPPLTEIVMANKVNQGKLSKRTKAETQPTESHYYEEQSSNESTALTSKRRETSPRSGTESKRIPSFRTLQTEPDSFDVDYYLKHLMIPRRMKISIGGVPFQEVIFVLAVKFFDKSPYFENFVFEWLDVQSSTMIGYIKCDFIKFVHKQGQKRFNIACKEPRGEEEVDEEEEVLHHVHIEADSPTKCELYVNGLNSVIKFMERSLKTPGS